MSPVVSDNCTDTDLSKMKFLVLALCVYTASALSTFGKVGGQSPWQVQAQASVVNNPVVPVPPRPAVKSVTVGSTSDVEAPILRSVSEVNADGFNYAYETGNGIVGEANGNLKRVDNLDVISVRGSYQYVAPDGTPIQVSYVADENGYQPQSDILPVAPPVPVAIARALEYIAAHPPAPEPVGRRV